MRIHITSFLFYLIIFFLPTQLGLHFWPSFATVFGYRVDYLSPTLFFTDVLILLLFFFWCPKGILLLKRKRKKPSKVTWCLLTYLVVLLIGVLFAKNLSAGMYGVVKLLECAFLWLYLISETTKKQRDTSLWVFASAMLAQSLLAYLQFFHQRSLGGLWYFLGERTFSAQTPGIANASLDGGLLLRPYGTFSHPNVLAGYLLIGLLLLVPWALRLKETWKKVLGAVVMLFALATLLLTLSRSAILVGIFCAIIYLVRLLLAKKNKRALLLMGSLGIVGLITYRFIFPRFVALLTEKEPALLRSVLIEQALRMWQTSPLFGVGLQNFFNNLTLLQQAHFSVVPLQPVHNIFLLVLAETGIVGFCFFVWFLSATVWRVAKQKHSESVFFLALALLSVGLLGLFDHYFLTLQQGRLLVTIVLALCWVRTNKKSLASRV